MEYIDAKTILTKCKSTEWFGTDYNMNIYRGCCHGCIYCDSRSECYRIDNFDKIKAKKDVLLLLRDELKRKVRSGVIGTGAMSDPYNPFEKELQLTRHSLELIDAFNFGISIVTKSALITRDTDILQSISEHSPVICKLTITTADDDLCRKIEPNVSLSSERFDAIRTLSSQGIFTGVVLMPVLPFIEDNRDNILNIIHKTADCGGKFIYPSFGVTLRQNQREHFLNKLDEIFPKDDLREKYIKTYGNSYSCISRNVNSLWKVFESECQKYGIIYKMKDIISAYKTGYEMSQLSFFS